MPGWVVVGAVFAVALGLSGSARLASAQDAGSVHVTVGAGGRQGEYDVPVSACSAGYSGPASWQVSASGTSALTQLTLDLGGGFDTILIAFGQFEYLLYAEEADIVDVRIDDRGTSATLTVQAAMTSPDMAEPVSVELVADCTTLDRSSDMPLPSGLAEPTPGAGTPAPTAATPTFAPVVLGSPAPGSTTLRLVLDAGPDAGTFEVWTLSGACRRLGESGWVVQYTDAATTPSSVSVLALTDATGAVGSAAFGFGTGPDARTWTAVAPTITIEDRGATATVHASGEAGTAGEAPAPFDLTVGCASVGS